MKHFVMINDKKVEILQKGQHGIPIVVLTGMGCSFEEWYEVLETLSETNQVLMFHRPGLGESEIGDDNRNTQHAAEELYTILGLLKIVEPVILVGHSYGGLCAQHFAKMHTQYVRALVLVDSTSEDLNLLDKLDLPVLNGDSTDEVWLEKCISYSLMNQDELSEIINPILTDKQKQLPDEIQQRLIEFQQKPSLYKAMHSEIKNWGNDAEVIKSLGGINNVPLLVIGRDKEFNIRIGIEEGLPEWEIQLFEQTWHELIKQQINLSRNSILIFAQQSSHAVHLDRPDIVVNEILKVIKQTS